MLLARSQRMPWQLTCLLFASVAAATISPSNTSTVSSQFSGFLPLQHTDSGNAQIASLVPLTREAAQRTIEGNLYNTNFSNVANISDGEIAYISCNPSDYSGYDTPQGVFQQAYESSNISGVILYSTQTDYCSYVQDSGNSIMQSFPILSMANKTESAMVRNAIVNLPVHMKYFVQVVGRGNTGSTNTNNNNNQQTNQNPLGPSPSTAVAMIILYSITGVITALFLIIIVTGAIRAHRHPERYGPRNVLGRPRQSRARGLGRAILDTIPIVKFGEKEAPKPTDVESGSSSEARDVTGANADTALPASNAATEGTEMGAVTSRALVGVAETPNDASKAPVDDHQEGIAPAQPLTAAATTGSETSGNDENLGCSICTEDFELGQDLRVLPCDHKFHPECVDPWLLNVSGTCPLCRVDLHPVTSHDSTTPTVDEAATTTTTPEADASHRRRSAFRDILSLRQRPNASTEERIVALRRLREQRINRSGDVATAGASAEDVTLPRDRRSKRMSVRLSNALHGRARRDRQDESPGESSGAAQHPRDGSPPPPPPDASAGTGTSAAAHERQ